MSDLLDTTYVQGLDKKNNENEFAPFVNNDELVNNLNKVRAMSELYQAKASGRVYDVEGELLLKKMGIKDLSFSQVAKSYFPDVEPNQASRQTYDAFTKGFKQSEIPVKTSLPDPIADPVGFAAYTKLHDEVSYKPDNDNVPRFIEKAFISFITNVVTSLAIPMAMTANKDVASALMAIRTDSEKKAHEALNKVISNPLESFKDVPDMTMNAAGQMAGSVSSDPALLFSSLTLGTAVGTAVGNPVGGAAYGFMGFSSIQSARVEARNLEVELLRDPEFHTLLKDPKKGRDFVNSVKAIAGAYGVMAGAVEGFGDRFMPGMAEAVSKVARAKLYSGSLKAQIAEKLKQIGKGSVAEGATEVIQELMSNVATNGAIMYANENSGGDPKKFIELSRGAADSFWQGMAGGAGMASGMAVMASAFKYGSNFMKKKESTNAKPDSTAQQIAALPVSKESEAQVSADASPISSLQFHAVVSEGGPDAEVRISTSKETAVAQSKGIEYMSARSFASKVKEKFGDTKATDAIIGIIQGNMPDGNTRAMLEAVGVDPESVTSDIVPHLGQTNPPSYFSESLRAIGISPEMKGDVATVSLDSESTLVINRYSDAAIQQAKADGYKAVAWKDGNEWSGIVLDSTAVKKVATESISPSEEVGTEITPVQKVDIIKTAVEKSVSEGFNVLAGNKKFKARLKKNMIEAGLSPEDASNNANILEALSNNSSTSYNILERMSLVDIKTDANMGKAKGKTGSKKVVRGRYDASKDGARGFKLYGMGRMFVQPNPEPITILHEFIHVWQEQAPDNVLEAFKEVYGVDFREEFGTPEWVQASEVMTDDLLKYFATGIAPTNKLARVFNEIGRFLKTVIDEYIRSRPQYQIHNKEVKAFFDDLFSGKFVAYSKQEIEESITETRRVQLFMSEDGFNLETVLNFIEANETHNIPTEVLQRFMDDDRIRPFFLDRILSQDIAQQLQTYTDNELAQVGGFEESDFALRDRIRSEIGFKWAEWNPKFLDLAKKDIDLVSSMIKKHTDVAVLPAWFDGTQESKERLFRDIKRKNNTDKYREAFWHSMAMEDDKAYVWAASAEADRQVAIRRVEESENATASDEDFVQVPTYDSEAVANLEAMSKDKIVEDLLKAFAETDRISEELKDANDKIAKELRKAEGREKARITRLLKSKKIIDQAMERLSVESGNGVDSAFADAIDFLASLSTKYKSHHERIRDRASFNSIKATVENYNSKNQDSQMRIDMVILGDLVTKDPDSMTLADINTLIEYKGILNSTGREVRRKERADRIENRGQAYFEKLMSRLAELGKTQVTAQDISAFHNTKEVFSVVQKGIPLEVINTLMNAGVKISDMPDRVMDLNRGVKNDLQIELNKMKFGDGKTKDERDAFEEKTKEDRAVRREKFISEYMAHVKTNDKKLRNEQIKMARDSFAKNEEAKIEKFKADYLEANLIKKLTNEEVSKTLDDIRSAKEPNLKLWDKPMVGTRGYEISVRGEWKQNIREFIRTIELSSDRFPEFLDGYIKNGPFKELFFDLYRGGTDNIGWEPAHLRDKNSLNSEFKKRLIDLGIGPSELFNTDVIVTVDGNVLSKDDAKKLSKKEKLDYTKYVVLTPEQVMEIYASRKSMQKMSAITHGNGISVLAQDAVIAQMPESHIKLADWILFKYSERTEQLRHEYELHSGKKFKYSEGTYSSMVRIMDDYSVEVGKSFQATPGMSQSQAVERIQQGLDNQAPISLDFISTFFSKMDDSSRIINGIVETDVVSVAMGFNDNKERQLMLKMAIGESSYKYLHRLYGDIVTDNPMRDSKEGKLGNWLLRMSQNLSISQLALVPRTAATQFFAYFNAIPTFRNQAMAMVSIPYYLLKNIGRALNGGYSKHIRDLYNESPFLWERSMDQAIQRARHSKLTKFARGQAKLKESIMVLTTTFDEISVASIYEARKSDEIAFQSNEVKKNESGDIGVRGANGMLERLAINAAVETISKTQPNSDIMSTSELHKRYKVLASLLFPFSQAMFKIFNQLFHDSRIELGTTFRKKADFEKAGVFSFRARTAKRIDAASRVATIWGGYVITGAVSFVMLNARMPEDDEDLWQILNNLIGPLGMIGRGTSMVAQATTGTYYRSSFTPLGVAWSDDLAKMIEKAQNSEEVADWVMVGGKSLAVLPFPTAETKNLLDAVPAVEDGDWAEALRQAWGGK